MRSSVIATLISFGSAAFVGALLMLLALSFVEFFEDVGESFKMGYVTVVDIIYHLTVYFVLRCTCRVTLSCSFRVHCYYCQLHLPLYYFV